MYSYFCKKKYMLFLLLGCVLSSTLLYAEDPKPCLLNAEGTVSGDFVMYRDYSWKEPTWIGFLYYDDETYGAVLYTPSKNSRVSILFSCTTEDGRLELTGQKIISKITQDDTFAVNYLMSILPSLYSYRVMPEQRTGLFASETETIDDEMFGGTAYVQFDNYVPLFHIKTLDNAEHDLILELQEIGTVQGKPDLYFYNYVPVEPKKSFTPYKRKKNAKKESVKVLDLTFHLDSGWKKIADTSFLYGDTAFLTATVLNIPKEEKSVFKNPEKLIRYFLSSGSTAKVMLPYTTISGTEKKFTIMQSVYDVQLQKINKDIKCCKKNNDGSYTVISLTVDSHAYSADSAYFNAIFPFF